MKKYHKQLKELINEVILNDIEEQIDEVFAVIAKEKKADEQYSMELKGLREMKKEFEEILKDIEDDNLNDEEAEDLYNEIMDMISEDEDQI